jgi:cytochrome c5
MKHSILTSKSKILMLAAGLLLASCYYDNEETLYPGSANCDPTAVGTFNADVMPLLNARCNSCHAGTSPSGGIKLDSYTEVIKYVENGSLIGSIEHASGFSAMPKNGSKMTTCQIQTIQSWIDAGALNN